MLFVQNGVLTFDVGWVGAARSRVKINDGLWHHVGLVVQANAAMEANIAFYVDGRPAGRGRLDVAAFEEAHLPVRIGYGNKDFPRPQSGFNGLIDEVRWYGYALEPEAMGKVSGQGVD